MIVRIAEEKDIKEIVDLLITAFPHHTRSRKHWDWSHSDGRGLAVIAEDEDRIIGHYSFGYQSFQWHGREYTAGFGQQAAVHPEHRDLRTIVELIRFTEQVASKKCDFVFAFPNGNMAPIKERVLDWKKILTFPAWTLPLADFNRNVHEMVKASISDYCLIRQLTTFTDLDCTRFTATDTETLTPIKNADWFEWRYIMNPQNHYACFGTFADGQCEGVMVLKIYYDAADRRGHVLELHSRDDIELKLCLLLAAADFFEFMGVDQVFVWNQYKPNQPLYEKLGLKPSSFTSTLYAKALTESSQDVVTADWSFDMGVSDVF